LPTVIPGFRSPRDPWPRFLFSPRHIRAQKWGFLFDNGKRKWLMRGKNLKYMHAWLYSVTSSSEVSESSGQEVICVTRRRYCTGASINKQRDTIHNETSYWTDEIQRKAHF
jgi:hypothetical protein